ncbi:MAG: hypothetical protein H0U74_10405 [Bradymonadaceae bacterium]|nr:hypothetical protein [Lujinxingiaceae bacterium]
MKLSWCVLAALLFVVGCGPATPSPQPSDDSGLPDAAHSPDIDDNNNSASWRWIEIEGSACGNGTPTGLGISEGSDPSRMMIFFAGGGACWDTASCYVFNAASHIETRYGEQRFASDLAAMQNSGIIDRASGPFAEATFVFVPYCTGDLHAGDAIGSYDAFNPNRLVHHKGAVNVAAYLGHLTAAYPDVSELYVLGVSAGGYGAVINQPRIQAAYPGARVHVLSDCSPMVQPRDGRWGMWKSAWKMAFPEGCDGCADSFPELAAHIVESSPNSRFGLLAWHDDAVVAVFFAYQSGLGAATRKLIEDVYPGQPGSQASAFHMPGTEHVMLPDYETLKDPDGQSLRSFVQAWVDGTH